MKSKFLVGGLILIALGVFYSCSKKINSKLASTPKPLQITLDHSKSNQAARGILEQGELGGYDACAGHGGTIGFGQSWDIATCKSGCEKGLGFRCGSEKYLICNDGTHIPLGSANNHCPKSTLTAESRAMNADIVFYDDNTIKIVFKNSVPPSEIGNINFEIESDETIDLPNFISIGGTIYSGYRIYEGIYHVDYSEGEFGSVIMPILLVP